MVCLRDIRSCIIFICLSGILICGVCLLFFYQPFTLILNLDPRLSPSLHTSLATLYETNNHSIADFYKQTSALIPSIKQIQQQRKPHGTCIKITVDDPLFILKPSGISVSKNGHLTPGTLLTQEQHFLLQEITILEEITENNKKALLDFLLHKALQLSHSFTIEWHNKTTIALIPHESFNATNYTIVIHHDQELPLFFNETIKKFLTKHTLEHKNQQKKNWIVDLRFDDWWIVHTRGLQGSLP